MSEETTSNSAGPLPRRSPRWWRRAQLTARQINLFMWLEVICAVALATMLFVSYFSIANMTDASTLFPSGVAAAILILTLLPALGLIILWGRRAAIRRAGGASARLHVNMVFFFSLMAAIPTLFVAVFASILFQSGVAFWFSDDQQELLENASDLTRGYYDENQREVEQTTVAMASDIRFFLQEMNVDSPDFVEQFALQLYSRELSEGAILQLASDDQLRTIAVVDPYGDFSTDRISSATLERLRSGETAVVTANNQRTQATTALYADGDVYLYTSRNAHGPALAQWQRAQDVAASYEELTENARIVQLQFNLTLFVVSLSLVGLAVFAALRFADRQVKPLTELAHAAQEIGAGNYAMRVAGRTGPDEIGLLNRAFNRMTAQIESQNDELVGANHQLGERRAFMEAVLQSITAGIISVDAQGKVLLMNASAQDLILDGAGPTPVGLELEEIAPDIAQLLKSGTQSGLVQYSKDGELLTLAVKVAPATEGFVITFEDITRQLVDQRQAAWSDVARRIAHEIKNPLTPIQLATERLKRRYGRQIEEDVDLFDELTGTIIRQVGDLRKMVDEFSSFARLPKPNFRQEDALDLIRQSLFLQEVAHPEITYRLMVEGDVPPIECDRHQIGQAMTNVLKNAAEAIDAKTRDAEPDYRGNIQLNVKAEGEYFCVTVADNGVGLSLGSENIMEPYVTTREKGTGLGLAIVKKIIEEHGGELSFSASPSSGTTAHMKFAFHPADAGTGSEAAE